MALNARERDLLNRATRRTPVGQALRRHWLPVLAEADLPAADAPPVWLRVMGEALVLFRDTSGRLGVLDAYCPHEGGSLTNGRNGDNALQCMLHGWAFDVTGRRVDGGAAHQGAARTVAYPVRVRHGRVWVYLGPPEQQPEFPADSGQAAATG